MTENKLNAGKNSHPLWLITQDVTKISVWVLCILWHVLIITMFLDIKISGYAIVFMLCLFSGSMAALVAAFACIGACEDKKAKTPNGKTIFQKYVSFKQTILRGWGMLFRTLFISCIAIAGYQWIDPQPIGNTSLPDLTVRQFFGNLFAFLLVAGCVVWFLKFPKSKAPMSEDISEYPYLVWGLFGVILIALVIMVGAYGGMLLDQL
ncbi:MAG: hypothetical protein H6864_03035 [Micavibrio sp.]|nr:hypothetical protein [Micavibrio sp.]